MQSISHRSHVEVIEANKGKEVFGIENGQLLTVTKETDKFVYLVSFTGKEIKVSKQTRKACHWRNSSTSPTFNI